MTTLRRRLRLTAASLRAYSRAGNFHSDRDQARRLGLPGLVAQGMHAAAPAYGLLVDTWGEEFLARGELDLKFVGMVFEDATVEAAVEVDGIRATAEIVIPGDGGRLAVVGRARRTAR